MSTQSKGFTRCGAVLVRYVATELAAGFIHLSAAADRVESAGNSRHRKDAPVRGASVSPSVDELREGAANVLAAVLVKARGRELTDHNELEKALHAASILVDAVADYVSARAQAEQREALEGTHS